MVKPPHEALHQLFQEDPYLFARSVSRLLGEELPAPKAVSVLNSDLNEITVMERRVDTVLWLEHASESHILVVESQTSEDKDKRRSWPHYVTHLYDKYKCDVTLLVVCPDAATARWARQPIRIGLKRHPTNTTTAIVLGPDNVPAITDAAQARGDVVFTLFSALTHQKGSAATGILEALAAALETIDLGTAKYFAEFTETGLDEGPVRDFWRNLMTSATYHYPSQLRLQGREEGREEGRAEGEAKAVLRVLDKRGVDVHNTAREEILACTDLATLDAWLDRSLTISTIDELFA